MGLTCVTAAQFPCVRTVIWKQTGVLGNVPSWTAMDATNTTTEQGYCENGDWGNLVALPYRCISEFENLVT